MSDVPGLDPIERTGGGGPATDDAVPTTTSTIEAAPISVKTALISGVKPKRS